MHTLKLIRPTQEYADQVMEYRQEMLDNGDSLDGCAALEDTNSYAEWAAQRALRRRLCAIRCVPGGAQKR